MKILLLILIAAFAQGCAGMADVWPRCRHEYVGYEVDQNGNRTDRYDFICD